VVLQDRRFIRSSGIRSVVPDVLYPAQGPPKREDRGRAWEREEKGEACQSGPRYLN
jgi:hypothetical protein